MRKLGTWKAMHKHNGATPASAHLKSRASSDIHLETIFGHEKINSRFATFCLSEPWSAWNFLDSPSD